MPTAKIFPCPETPTIDKPTVTSWQVMDTPDIPHLSLSIMTKKPAPGHVSKNDISDIAYIVIAGHGNAYIEGNTYPIKKGDVVFVPKGATYSLSDGMELVAACTPRFGS